MDVVLSIEAIQSLISNAVQIGFQKAMETASVLPKDTSRNKAWKRYGRMRIDRWEAAGLLHGRKLGDGKTSTIYYNTARLMELDAADIMVVGKS